MAPAQKKTLTFRRAPWTAEALEHLAAAERYDTTGGLESVDAYARMGIPLYEGVDEAGEVLGRYVMEVQTGMDGVKNVQVVAASGGCSGGDMAQAIMAAAEKQAELLGAQWVSYQTVRLGLIAKGRAQGYGIHGVVMRKRVGPQQ